MRVKLTLTSMVAGLEKKKPINKVNLVLSKWAVSSFSIILASSSLETTVSRCSNDRLPMSRTLLPKTQATTPLIGLFWQKWLYFVSLIFNIIKLKSPFYIWGSSKYLFPSIALASKSWSTKPWRGDHMAFSLVWYKKTVISFLKKGCGGCLVLLEPLLSQSNYNYLKKNNLFMIGFSQKKKIQKLLWGPNISLFGSLEMEGVILSFISLTML